MATIQRVKNLEKLRIQNILLLIFSVIASLRASAGEAIHKKLSGLLRARCARPRNDEEREKAHPHNDEVFWKAYYHVCNAS